MASKKTTTPEETPAEVQVIDMTWTDKYVDKVRTAWSHYADLAARTTLSAVKLGAILGTVKAEFQAHKLTEGAFLDWARPVCGDMSHSWIRNTIAAAAVFPTLPAEFQDAQTVPPQDELQALARAENPEDRATILRQVREEGLKGRAAVDRVRSLANETLSEDKQAAKRAKSERGWTEKAAKLSGSVRRFVVKALKSAEQGPDPEREIDAFLSGVRLGERYARGYGNADHATMVSKAVAAIIAEGLDEDEGEPSDEILETIDAELAAA